MSNENRPSPPSGPDQSVPAIEESKAEGPKASRLNLIWNVFIFQLKLAFDGIRDVLLVPASLIAALAGLLTGGDEPDRHFKHLLEFGRRTETWLNLFGHRQDEETSDDLIKPIQERVFETARDNAWLSKTGGQINQQLDSVNARLARKSDSDSPD